MTALLIVVHIIVSIILILSVLLQSGKAADLASAFGAQGSQTAFGIRGSATFLAKLTTAAAILFMVTSLALAIVYSQGTSSEVSEAAREAANVEQKAGSGKTEIPATTQPAATGNATTTQSENNPTQK
jgi:preprotein translocase subunit SecG